MTDMLHKPNGWNSPLNQMTEDEWKEYFRLREELDVVYAVSICHKISHQDCHDLSSKIA